MFPKSLPTQRGLSLALALVLPLALALLCTGCLGIKKTTTPARHFVLSTTTQSPAQSGDATTASRGDAPAIGLGPVQMTPYLSGKSIAVRRGNNEIKYLENNQWAEPLDKGVFRVLAYNLAVFLDSNRILPNAWQRDAVSLELYITITKFEVNEQGAVQLEALWRVHRPGQVNPLHYGHGTFTREGPRPDQNIEGAVGTMSASLELLARQIAAEIQPLKSAQ